MTERDKATPPLRWTRWWSGRRLPRNVRALAATSLLQDVASEMVYPLLPGFLLLLGGGAALLGVMESAAEGVLALVKGWAGRASDRKGHRKPFVVGGYGLSAATRPLLALATAPFHVIFLRVGDRFAKGLRTAPRDALIAESTTPDHRALAFAYHRGLDHLGAAVGPLLAAGLLLLAPGHYRLVFALATLPALAGVGFVALRVHETAPPPRDRRRDDAPTAVPPDLRLPLAAFFLFALGNASDAFLLLRAGDMGIGPVGLTLLWSAFHVFKWLASAPSGHLADRWGPRRLVLAGWLLYAVVYLGFAAANTMLPFCALLAVYALYYGLTEGAERALVVSLGAAEAGAGSVLGAFHLVSGLGVFVASLLFGGIWQLFSPGAAFSLGAALAATSCLLLVRSPRQPTGAQRRSSPEGPSDAGGLPGGVGKPESKETKSLGRGDSTRSGSPSRG